MGGKSSDEQTVKNEPWGGVQQPLTDLYSSTQSALGNIQDYYPGQTYPNLTPLQESGMYGNMDYAQNYYAPAAMGYQQALGQYMDAPLNITNDPVVQNMFNANEQSATDWLTRSALPSVRQGAISAGQMGSSRQGIAEGLAIAEADKNLRAANAQTALSALDPMTKLAGYSATQMPGALQMGFMPGDLAQQYGGVYQGLYGQGIQEDMLRYAYPEQSLWDKLGQAGNIYSGAGSYGTKTSDMPGASPLAGAVGGGLAGAGAYSSLLAAGPPTGIAAGLTAGGMWPLALGGAVLGGLFS